MNHTNRNSNYFSDRPRSSTVSKTPSLSFFDLSARVTGFSNISPPHELEPNPEIPLPPASSKPPCIDPASAHIQYISSSPQSPSSHIPPIQRFPSSPSLGRSFDINNKSPYIAHSPKPPSLGHVPDHKGKAPYIPISPPLSPRTSPRNSFDQDIDLLKKASLKFQPLTVHRPNRSPLPNISPNSARNITVRRKEKRGSRHFRGRKGRQDSSTRDLSLIEIPITEIAAEDIPLKRPLRACRPNDFPK